MANVANDYGYCKNGRSFFVFRLNNDIIYDDGHNGLALEMATKCSL